MAKTSVVLFLALSVGKFQVTLWYLVLSYVVGKQAVPTYNFQSPLRVNNLNWFVVIPLQNTQTASVPYDGNDGCVIVCAWMCETSQWLAK